MLALLAASSVLLVISSVVKGIARRGVRRIGRENNHMDKNFISAPSFNPIQDGLFLGCSRMVGKRAKRPPLA